MVRRKINIVKKNNEILDSLKTETFAGGLFAVHGTYLDDSGRSRKEFTLTHVPTGYAVTHGKNKHWLIDAIPQIVDLGFPWLSKKAGVIVGYGKRNPDKVKELKRLVGGF